LALDGAAVGCDPAGTASKASPAPASKRLFQRPDIGMRIPLDGSY
jgi:hypothetical protein